MRTTTPSVIAVLDAALCFLDPALHSAGLEADAIARASAELGASSLVEVEALNMVAGSAWLWPALQAARAQRTDLDAWLATWAGRRTGAI